MFSFVRRWFWRRRVRKYAPEQCSLCIVCGESIYLGEFVGEADDGLVHAGFHFSPAQGEDIFCETGGVGIGFWNGAGIDRLRRSAVEATLATGQMVTRTIGPGGQVTDIFTDVPQPTEEQ